MSTKRAECIADFLARGGTITRVKEELVEKPEALFKKPTRAENKRRFLFKKRYN